jgi:DNA-binding NarL/FixJ family response regulator
MIHVALADDHAILRKGVAELISKFNDMIVVAEGGNGHELLQAIKATPTLPDIAILDINMPLMNGYETAAAIKQQFPSVKILAMSM